MFKRFYGSFAAMKCAQSNRFAIFYDSFSVTKWAQSSCSFVFFQVQCPVLFILGADDKRVPAEHGLSYVRKLKARGIEHR